MSQECIFCQISQKKIHTQLLYEDEDMCAFFDICPQTPKHTLIIPKQHLVSLNDCSVQNKLMLGKIMLLAKKLACDHKFDKGYRLVNNCGEHGGQTISHLHFHLLGGRQMHWPPG